MRKVFLTVLVVVSFFVGWTGKVGADAPDSKVIFKSQAADAVLVFKKQKRMLTYDELEKVSGFGEIYIRESLYSLRMDFLRMRRMPNVRVSESLKLYGRKARCPMGKTVVSITHWKDHGYSILSSCDGKKSDFGLIFFSNRKYPEGMMPLNVLLGVMLQRSYLSEERYTALVKDYVRYRVNHQRTKSQGRLTDQQKLLIEKKKVMLVGLWDGLNQKAIDGPWFQAVESFRQQLGFLSPYKYFSDDMERYLKDFKYPRYKRPTTRPARARRKPAHKSRLGVFMRWFLSAVGFLMALYLLFKASRVWKGGRESNALKTSKKAARFQVEKSVAECEAALRKDLRERKIKYLRSVECLDAEAKEFLEEQDDDTIDEWYEACRNKMAELERAQQKASEDESAREEILKLSREFFEVFGAFSTDSAEELSLKTLGSVSFEEGYEWLSAYSEDFQSIHRSENGRPQRLLKKLQHLYVRLQMRFSK